MAPYAKAITALVSTAVLAFLASYGITGDTSLMEAINILIPAVLVYFVPNRA